MRPIYSAKLKLPDPLALLSNLSILATQFFNHLSFICDRLIKKWTPEDCQRVIPLIFRRIHVTYMEVSSPFEDLSDIGSPGVDGLPMMLEDPYVEAGIQAPLSLDYVPGPEHPPFPVYVTYVPETAYPEFIPPEDDVLPAEEQPLPAAISPTADSPGYITKSDLEEDSEEDNKDPEEDPADYPTNRDDGKEEEEEESFGDDADDKKENEDDKEEEDEDKEEEEEHLPPSNSIPPPVHHVTARISIRAQTRISLPSETEFKILITHSTTITTHPHGSLTIP
ncbi:hypothetical protein Tco_0367081 [Tanacetum coccineum]